MQGMKFRVTMKNPDGLHRAVKEAAREAADMGADWRRDCEAAGNPVEGSNIEALDEQVEDLMDLASTWFEYGEYLTVEIDTEAKTCVVVPRK
jgi:hypothetical protein